MLKKISAALLLASMITAPALAATAVKTEKAPVTKSDTMKPSVSNAKAQATDTKTVKKVTPRRSHRLHVSHRVTKKHVASKMTNKKMAHHGKTMSKKVSAAKPAAKQIKNKV